MVDRENKMRVTLSVLDRLIDLEPRESREAPKSRSASMAELRQAVRRDLEWLLNTRCVFNGDETELVEARRSVAFYGLPDFTGMGVLSNVEQKRLIRALEEAIRLFEPRFMDLKVVLEPIDQLDRQLKFRIQARLDVDPAPEPIAFDSVLQPGAGGFVLTER